MKNFLLKLLTTSFLLATSYLLLTPPLFAENFESERYKIQFGDVNIGGENDLKSGGYDLSVSLGQSAAGEFSSNGYIVKAGFQYINSIIPFRFTISNVNINLGTLVPNTPATASTTLTVSFGGVDQYQVTAAQTGPLAKGGGAIIPDTKCNGGGESCNESQAQEWTSNTAYGFGYNMSGNDTPETFINSKYYRPFPDISQNEPAQTIMSSSNVGKNRQAEVNFKAVISPLQEVGSYQTVIKFIATPGY